jgi:hypothetical protein
VNRALGLKNGLAKLLLNFLDEMSASFETKGLGNSKNNEAN